MSRYKELISYLKNLNRVIVAFSGGIDSYFVLKASVDSLGRNNVLAVTGNSPSLKQTDKNLTVKLASSISASHKIIFTDELNNPDYYNNPKDRCFYCKNELFNKLCGMKNDLDYSHVLDGTNFDDMNDYRPGYTASRNHGIKSPLVDLKFTKKEIREISKELGLEIWNKPASPCLSSRIPYGQHVTPEKLDLIEKAENILRESGFTDYRVRFFEINTNGNILKMAKIEIPGSEMEKIFNTELFSEIDKQLRSLGYDFVTLDMRGLRSGSLNSEYKLPVLNNF